MDPNEPGEFAKTFEMMHPNMGDSQVKMGRRERDLALLNEVGLVATQMLDLEKILDLTLDIMVNKLGMAVALAYLWDEDAVRYTLHASYGVSAEQIEEIDRRRRSGFDITQEVVESGKAVFVANMAADPRFHGVWDELDGRSYVKLPMLSRGTVVGVLGLVSPVGQSLTARDVEFLKAVGREIGIAIDNAILLAETRQREQAAVTLYNLGTKISASLAIDDVLEVVVEAARELVSADIALVGLVDQITQQVVIGAATGTLTNALIGMQLASDRQSPWSALVAGQPIMVSGAELKQSSLHDAGFLASEKIEGLLAVPLQRGGKFIGLIEVLARQPRRFQPRGAQLLTRLAQQVVVAVENAQLYRKLHYMASLEERDRLAREMHDHLSQGLGYLKVKASITEELLSSGQIDLAHESLLELKKATQILYTDVREEIFNLRTAVTERMGFLATLQDYLLDYRTHYGLSVNLLIENECLNEFTSEVAGQLLRIIQEALTNVRRHAGAGNVLIHCQPEREQVCINIQDDGRGFYLDQAMAEGQQRYGLQIMRERAESIGGSLELVSQPGHGTRVIIRLPCGCPG